MTDPEGAPTVRRRGRPGGLAGAELLSEARGILLRDGYAATTMDAVAAAARISKQTLYRHYASKEALFSAVVADWVDQGREAMRPHLDRLARTEDVRLGLAEFAGVLHAGVLSEPVVRMRSLVIAEAERLPEVAADYRRRSWDRNERLLADVIGHLSARGLLDADDSIAAARQFTWLVLGAPLDRLTLTAGAGRFSPAELSDIASEAVDTFLARYGSSALH